MIGLMFILIFMSLFTFIYEEQVKLPSDNWSNAIEIDSYNPNMDFESLSANNTFAAKTSDSGFVNVVALDNTLSMKSYDISGQLTSETTITLDHALSEVSGEIRNGSLELITLSQDKKHLNFITLNPETFEQTASKSVLLENMVSKLSKDHVTAFNREEVAFIKDGEAQYFTPGFDGRIERAETNQVGETLRLSAITMKGSTYHLELYTVSGSEKTSEQLYTLPSLSAINPVHLAMATQDGETVIVTTMKHMRFGTNYVDFFLNAQNGPDALNHSGYEVDTYEAIPYLIEEESGDLSYIINFWASNLGRTEIAKGVQAYPNLYLTTHGTDTFKQLTKSERSSVKPSYMHLGEYDYLIYNEQNELENIVYMASNNPKIVAASRDYSSETLFDIFMRTITTYPALILAGIPPLLTVILPVLVITAPILMFKLNWAEQNKEKMTLMIIVVFILSKIYAFGFDIFPFFTEEGLWPTFMASPLTQWLALFGLSILTYLIYMSRNKSRTGQNDHFLKQITFYIILDVVVMICFFMPYSII
jgi:hypothetical protein